jgi:hypothetical protein
MFSFGEAVMTDGELFGLFVQLFPEPRLVSSGFVQLGLRHPSLHLTALCCFGHIGLSFIPNTLNMFLAVLVLCRDLAVTGAEQISPSFGERTLFSYNKSVST